MISVKTIKNYLPLILVFLLSLLFRLYDLNNIPNGFHIDEIYAGYVGRYIWLYGKDIHNNFLPIFFDRFGDFRPTGIFYLSGLSTFLFGINEFAVRFPSALFGSLSVIAIYFLTNQVFGNKKISLITSLLLAILPWHIELSRATSEGIIGLFFIIIALTLLIRGLRNKNIKIIILSFLMFFISYIFYHAFRFLVPFIVLPFVLYGWKDKYIRFILIFTTIIFFAISITLIFTNWGGGRLNQVAFYKNKTLPNKTESLISGEGNNNILTARIFHNKLVIYTRELIGNYLLYISPDFLFQQGGLPLRYYVPQEGLLYYSLFIFIIAGLIGFQSKLFRSNFKYLILYLLFISFIPAALTYDDIPNVHRSIFFICPVIILSALGLYYLIKIINNKSLQKTLIIIIFIFMSIEIIYFLHQYFIHAQTFYSFLRNDGNKETANVLTLIKSQYTKILISKYDDLDIYYLFYNKDFNKNDAQKISKKDITYNIDNIFFLQTDCPSKYVKDALEKGISKNNFKNVLLIDNGTCLINGNFKIVDTVIRKDSTMAYRLLKLNI